VISHAEALQERLGAEFTKSEEFRLFFNDLGYDFCFDEYFIEDWKETLRKEIKKIEIINEYGDFKIFLIKIDKLTKQLERKITIKISEDNPRNLAIFWENSKRFDLVNMLYNPSLKQRNQLRRFSIETENVSRTTAQQIFKLKIPDDKISSIQLENRCISAFDIEQVTKQFFEDYIEHFDKIKSFFRKKGVDDPHYATQLILNRLMFLYFVQAKGWLKCGEENPKSFFKSFRNSFIRTRSDDTLYHKEWLNSLFHYSLNNKDIPNFKSIPDSAISWVKDMPYLNGGLFRKDEIDFEIERKEAYLPFKEYLKPIHEDLLERYNFTISEDSSWDVDVAIDPEMLGHVYESLILKEQRGKAGIFYTQQVEIEMMTRLPIFHFLIDELGLEVSSNKGRALGKLVIDLVEEEEDIETITSAFSLDDLNIIQKLLKEITVCDPACGSGAFLVASMTLLRELHHRLHSMKDQTPPNDFELKKEIIEKNIYGGELLPWAVNVAQLRLWLSLIVDSDLPESDERALLPSLHFKIGIGDSLVQKIGNQHINLRAIRTYAAGHSVGKELTKLAEEKHNFFINEYSGTPDKQKSKILKLEKAIFIHFLKQEIMTLQKKKQSLTGQTTLMGSEQAVLDKASQKEVEGLQTKLMELTGLIAKISSAKSVPFVWDITFCEILLRRGGFDIVIGNPPYVRLEKIVPPSEYVGSKEDYKKDLFNCALSDWPIARPPKSTDKLTYGRFLVWWGKTQNIRKRTVYWPLINIKKNDLYFYFYLKGLSLLRPGGQFSFISSNSWLDVGYGKILQSFLCQFVKINSIIDNHSKRSFKHADVNTIICNLTRPTLEELQNVEENTAFFIAFKKPYEEIFSSKNYFKATTNTKREDLKNWISSPLVQKTLYLEGTKLAKRDVPPAQIEIQFNTYNIEYEGNKWGGKYLRAPNLYFEILDNAKDKLVPLKEQIAILGYVHDNNTGSKYSEAHFIKNSRQAETIKLTKESKGVINYGVSEVGNSRIHAPILFPRTLGERHLVIWNPDEVYGKEFYRLLPTSSAFSICLQLNLTFSILQRELIGLTNLGGGGLKFSSEDIAKYFVIIPDLDFTNLDSIAKKFISRPPLNVIDELIQDDRRKLDHLVFEKLGLSNTQIERIYEETIKLVERRINKSKSK